MSLLALGLNHHTAPVNVRERAAIGENRLPEALLGLKNIDAVNEAAIVSTCNRTEIYCGLSHDDPSAVSEWLRDYFQLDDANFEKHLFHHTDRHAVQHLMRVCSGLDSLVLGEPQILGQMKNAYRDAVSAGTIGTQLNPLFESAFAVAKQIRTDTTIGNHAVSVAFAAVSLAKQIFDRFDTHSALVIGAGDTISLSAKHLNSNGIGSITIANRTVSRAQILAEEVGASAITLSDVPDALIDADIVISSTGSPLPILGKGMVERTLKARRYRPLLIVDIAVPRDVEPQVGELDNVFLYTVDDLQDVIDENRRSRQEAADQAEKIVERQVDLYMRKVRALGANDAIRSYRASVEHVQAAAVEKSLKQLRAGQDPQQVIEHLAHTLGNKLMHTPTQRLREAAEQGNLELIDAAKQLLDLDDSTS